MKRKILIVILTIVLVPTITYFAIFVAYFNSANFTKQIKRLAGSLTEREMRLSKASLSLLGKFALKNFELSDKNGFEHGTFMSVNDISVRISILKLLKADFIINGVHASGVTVYLNYENKRKFNHIELYDDIKKNFSEKYAGIGLIRKMEIRSIVIENGSLNLKLDTGNVKLNKIVLKSSLFDYHNNYFDGNVSFEFKIGAIQSEASFGFNYDRKAKTLRITDFICRDLSLSAEGTIKFLDDGKTKIEYTAKIKKEKLQKLTSGFAGYPVSVKDSANNMEDIIISYPNSRAEKEIKTVI
ncbi:MAG: AsmA family protein [Endomicrobium sp.]|nr:AsmA family protein [Endomicrobium sp.]